MGKVDTECPKLYLIIDESLERHSIHVESTDS